MAASFNLTLDDVRKQSANFLYVFTNFNVNKKPFLDYIDSKHRRIIESKRLNQLKILQRSALNAGYDSKKGLETYAQAAKEGFIASYGMNPENALVVLAQGGTVAGKNWAEGMYGVGALYPTNFYGHADVTVRKSDGHILKNGKDITNTTDTVLSDVNGNGDASSYQLFGTDGDIKYSSLYYKAAKEYYPYCYEQGGKTYRARDGKEMSAADGADLWGNVLLFLDKIADWILSLFGINVDSDDPITAENTAPNQKEDGFVVNNSGFDGLGAALLIAAAGGAVLYGMKGKKKSKKK